MTRLGTLATILATLLASASAQADIYYTVTTAGTIVSGYDAGAFGGVGDLAGYSYYALEVFDATTSASSAIPGEQAISPAPASVLLFINGQELVINGMPDDDLYFLADTLHLFGNNGSNADEIYSSVQDSSGEFFSAGIGSSSVDFLSSDNFAQDLTYTVPTSGTVNFGESLASSEVFVGTIESVALNVVPEPGSLSVFGLGLVGLGWVLRQRPAKRE